MRRQHVAQRSRLLVVRAALLDPDRFTGGDLHLIHEAAIPDGLEDAVGEAQYQQVLDCFLGQVVVDAVDLLLAERFDDGAVELDRRGEIAAEGLLHHDPRPARHRHALGVVPIRGAAAGEPGGTEPAHDHRELLGRRRQIEEAIPAGAALRVDLVQRGGQAREALGLVELTVHPAGRLEHRFAQTTVDLLTVVVVDGLAQQRAEGVVVEGLAPIADNGQAAGQDVVRLQVVQRRHELAMSEVARGAEDHKAARVRVARPAER